MTADSTPNSVSVSASQVTATAGERRIHGFVYATFLALSFFPAISKLVNLSGHSLHDPLGSAINIVGTLVVFAISLVFCLRALFNE